MLTAAMAESGNKANNISVIAGDKPITFLIFTGIITLRPKPSVLTFSVALLCLPCSEQDTKPQSKKEIRRNDLNMAQKKKVLRRFANIAFRFYNMIVVTGAAGFIPSCLIGKLNAEGYRAIVAVDDFSRADKAPNLEGKNIVQKIDRKAFPNWLETNGLEVEFVFHLGARTDTTEKSKEIFDDLNLNYSKTIWTLCCRFQIPLVYASSAATYGNGELGYNDDHLHIPDLKPLNPYAQSKQDFDLWVLKQEKSPFFWAGLKFFNVYGPNEYHKGKMASVIFHAFHQIKKEGKMKLFQSHKPGIEHGHQQRDFVYVMDVVSVCVWLMHHRKDSGIYNLGSGKARTFLDLALATFKAMGIEPDIEFIPTPESIREGYQYFTEANMEKLKSIGYPQPFTTLESGVGEYVSEYLLPNRYF